MNLDEGMPAPANRRAPQRKQPRKWKTPAALAAGAVLTATLAAFALSASNGGMQATEPVPPPAPAVTQPAEPQRMAEVDPTAWSTFIAFWSGWTEEGPKTRAAVFADTATDELAEGLRQTASYRLATVQQPIEEVEIVGASEYAAEFRVTFRNTDTGPLRVIMAADPEAKSGWLVTDISQIDG